MVGKCFPEICGEHILWGHYHHINHNQLDNRAENIRCISNSEHKKLHHKEDGGLIAVVAFNKDGELVGKWDSMSAAAEETGADYHHIGEIINKKGQRYTAKDLYWFRDEGKNEDYVKKISEMQNAKRQALKKKPTSKNKNFFLTFRKTGTKFA